MKKQPETTDQAPKSQTPPSVAPAKTERTASGQPLPPNTQAETPGARPYQEDPGQTLGIIGIVLNAMGIGPGGIIFGVMSRNKSKDAGFSTTLGTVSMVWGIVSTVFGVMLFLFYIGIFVFAVMNDDFSSKQTPPQNDWGSNSTESHI